MMQVSRSEVFGLPPRRDLRNALPVISKYCQENIVKLENIVNYMGIIIVARKH